LIGIIADRTKIKKKLLFYYTLIGSIVTCAAFFTNSFGSLAWIYLAICFVIGNVAAVGGTVFYNSILNHLVPKLC
jgi:MFS-type transporter involved in bile tolerance (Atg22 family)